MPSFGSIKSLQSAVQADLPPWISFSDFERTEWLTQMLGQAAPALLMH